MFRILTSKEQKLKANKIEALCFLDPSYIEKKSHDTLPYFNTLLGESLLIPPRSNTKVSNTN